MSTHSKDRDTVPDTALATIELVEKLGFTWKFDYEIPMPTDAKRRVQIRSEEHNSPRDMVTQYAAAMARGDRFPPPVLTLDDYLVDGNTRVEAARRNKYPTIQAVILQDNHVGATDSVRRRLHILGAAFNARHGKRVDRDEIIAAVLTMAEDTTYDMSRIAALIGVPDSMVRNILVEKRARDRAAEAGVVVNGSVPATQLRKLGSISEKFNDGPWLEMVKLTQDAGLSPNELAEVTNKVRAITGSDDERMTLLGQERKIRTDQIAEYKSRGKTRPSSAAQLRQRLGFVNGFQDNPTDLVEYSPNFAAQHLEALRLCADLLGRVITAQEAI